MKYITYLACALCTLYQYSYLCHVQCICRGTYVGTCIYLHTLCLIYKEQSLSILLYFLSHPPTPPLSSLRPPLSSLPSSRFILSMGYIGPLTIYAYFIVSSVINKFLMSSIASMVVRQERLEGDFRLVHLLNS